MSFDPVITAGAILAVALYLLGVQRYDAIRRGRSISPGVRARAGAAARWSPQRTAAFVAGVAAIVIALESPLDALADASFAAHMGQHLLLTMVAAPLLLLGAPLLLALAATPPPAARRISGAMRSPLVRFFTHPIVAWLAFVLVMWGAHFSGLYEASLENERIHACEHALFLGAALLFWQPVIEAGPANWPMPHPARILYIFLAVPQNAFLGVALLSARRVLYPHYAQVLGTANALADQQAGGAVMWLAGGFVMFVATLLAIAAWFAAERRAGERIDALLAARAASAMAEEPVPVATTALERPG